MAKRMIDIELSDSYDLATPSGDFNVVESTAQHQRQLLLNNKGDFKQNPTICVGTVEYFDDEHLQELTRAISVEFTRDGMEVKSIKVNNGTIVSDAFYA